MKLRLLIVLACTLLGVSACIIEPFGGDRGGGGRGEFYGGDRGGHDGERGGHDYGRRVWHP